MTQVEPTNIITPMTPLPKRRMSSARTGKRREKISYSAPNLIECTNCKAQKLPHSICPNCGTYKGRVVKAPKIKTTVRKSENK